MILFIIVNCIGSVDRKLTWFSFSFFKDHVEVYYDRKLVGEFKAKLRL